MNIDWASLVLVAITTVVVAVAVVGIYSLGVIALTSNRATARGGSTTGQLNPTRLAGYTLIGLSALIVVYGLYLIIPALH